MKCEANQFRKMARNCLTVGATGIFLTSLAFADQSAVPQSAENISPSLQSSPAEAAAPIEERRVASETRESVTTMENSLRAQSVGGDNAEPGLAEIKRESTEQIYTVQEDQQSESNEPGIAEVEVVETGEKYVIREGETQVVSSGESTDSTTVSTEAQPHETGASDTLSTESAGDAAVASANEPLSIEEQSQQPSVFSGAPGESTIDALIAVPVVNAQGEQLGTVEEVVMENESGAAGLVVSVVSEEEQTIYRVVVPVEEVSPQGNELLWQTELTRDELAQQEQYDPNEYQRVSQLEGTLDESRSAGLTQL